jgi:ketosteroid isomerase-like protein
MSSRNKEVIEKVNAAFARNDVEGFLAYCHEDFEWTMVGDESKKGKAAVRKWMGSAPQEAPKFSIDTVLADGDYVSCIGDMTMNEGGKVVPYSYCDVWRFRGDKIAELKAFVIKTEQVPHQTV